MKKETRIGVIGCGKISSAYFSTFARLPGVVAHACADLNNAAAEAAAEEWGMKAMTVDELLASDEIEVVLNLTIPAAHAEVNTRILEAGKHAYCEKPFSLEREEGQKVLALAKSKGLLVGCAPDTFLSAGQQTARKLIDDGAIGKPLSGTAFMMGHGPESWHPNPGFYYTKGGGPMFDMGPYYLTTLVNLLGPVKSVSGSTNRGFNERVAGHESRAGEILPVEIETHVAGILEFHSGAIVTIVTSFDVWQADHYPIEIHGTAGSLKVPDPNCFDGRNAIYRDGFSDWKDVPLLHPHSENSRGIGVADLADAAANGRPARCGGEIAYHVLDIMHAIHDSSNERKHIDIASTCERPAAMPMTPELDKLFV
ncbi:Gfo/Idh/MocA family oxidoreductase [Rubellicoccus peritrichatus]|uniref:Gfo/Idh/MocA family oxidoreductase n=1 Tax=Rubellicoccus peritrichatus TaxID=3080537 RepID=A0AAQ3QT55_9BACT|nr:Gfo/Idh/MocA family oxidoreductase [Puniceicoccus sp. CR14]WOO40951.1 Gfo/Idh/MocA family oxidoreductase [Puniceicoccus sp. CR14]